MSGNNQNNNIINIKEMETFSIEEKYDILKAKKLLASDLIDEDYRTSLLKYIKKAKGGKVLVDYTKNDIGRLSIKINGLKDNETCITQSIMWRGAKSTLCEKYYDDLDIVNAHPVLLLQTFNKEGYTTTELKNYVNHRDKFFKKLNNYGLDRDKVKVFIMSLCYGSSVNKFCIDENIKKLNFMIPLEEELRSNTKKLLDKNEMLKYKMKAIDQKGEDYININGTALAYYLQTIECACLMSMYNKLKKAGIKTGALIHDGLHIEKFQKYDKNNLILQLQIVIEEETTFKVELKFKKFEALEGLEDIIVIKTDKEGGTYITDKLKNDYIISQERIFMRINNVWTENDKVIKRNLIKLIGNMDILMKITLFEQIKLVPYSTMIKGVNSMLPFIEPTEDPDFIDKLWTSNLYKLCFNNGFYDFKNKELKNYDTDTHTTIKINRDFKTPNKKTIEEVYEKILNPIFNNDKEIMNTWLNYIARGLAGHIEDKNWGVGMGERDCGKGVLVGMLENCFGEYCRSTNSENFLFKKGQGDSAKSLSWLVPFEFRRLLLTNEITIGENTKINGNVIKKLSSGGDKIEARVNHKDEINFKIQARVCMFCNDLPPIEPADSKETAYMFRYPSKFLDPSDIRLGKPKMRPIMKEVNGEIEYEVNEEGEKIMINVCNYYKKDDNIKLWSKSEEVMNAFIHIIFNNYSDKIELPDSMKEDMNDFKEEEKEEDKFLAIFNYAGDSTYDPDQRDWVSIDQIKMLLRTANISLSPQKYKNYLLGQGCMKGKRLDPNTNKRVNCWINLQVNENVVQQLEDNGCNID